MRPLHLEMTAFGPFADTEEVDFENLPADRPYLIGGPTGAGKSSVLDAMVYALYGQLPDGRKQKVRLRSDHAEPSRECRVVLVFESRGERWRVTRTPKQVRLSPRSGEMKEKQPTARLEVWRSGDWEPVESGIIAIDSRMQQTIGLSAEQFSKVVVLPQGRFQQVLNSGTRERTELLRTLFGTEVFRAATERLDQRRQALRREVSDLDTEVRTERLGARRRIEALAGRLATRTEAQVIDLAQRTRGAGGKRGAGAPGPSQAADEATPSHDELREALDALSSGPVAELAQRLRVAEEADVASSRRLEQARSLAALVEARDAHLAERGALESSAARRASLAGLVESHDEALPVFHLLERFDRADSARREHARLAREALAELVPLLEEPFLGCPEGVREALAAAAADSTSLETDPRGMKELAARAEQAARHAVADLGSLLEEAAREDSLTAGRRRVVDDLEAAAHERAEVESQLAGHLADRERLEVELTEVRGLAKSVDQLERAATDSAALLDRRRELATAKVAHTDASERLATLGVAMARNRSELEEVQGEVAEATSRASQVAARAQAVEELDDLLGALGRRDELLAASTSTAKRLEAAESDLDATLTAFATGAAANLAASLVEGEPCPTCGSEVHPAPAEGHDGATPDAEDLRGARSRVEGARREQEELRDQISQLVEGHPGLAGASEPVTRTELEEARGRLQGCREAETLRDRLAARAGDLAEALETARSEHAATELEISRLEGSIDTLAEQLGDDAGSDVETLEAEHTVRLAALERATAALGRLCALEAELTELGSKVEAAEARLVDLETRTEVLDGRLAEADRSLEELAERIRRRVGAADPADAARLARSAAGAASELRDELADLASASKQLDALGEEVSEALRPSRFGDAASVRAAVLADDQLESHRRWIGDWDRRHAVVTEALGRAEHQDLPDEAPDVEAIALRAESVAATTRSLADAAAAARSEIEGIEELLETARTKESGGESSVRELALLDEVHGVLSGTRTSNRLAVEAWVLSSYLREVVAAANVHLRSMTDGRFTLEVDSSHVGGSAKTGLDLEVIDADTGTPRPTLSLSGGETFQASLALALGLADVLTAGAAGLGLDALFVDEGFGTLDADSVDTVIDVLDGLRNRGAMVGLISHVEAMKDALPVALEVHKRSDHRGSRLRQPAGV